jgi:hypothetical protein
MKASRLIFTLLLASSVAVVQLATQQTKADQKSIEEVKAKAEAGDAESQVELGLRYDRGEGSRGGREVVSQSRRTELRRRSIQFGHVLRTGRGGDGGLGRGLKVAVADSEARP